MSDALEKPKLPKLPPLPPRKGNRTIYLADDALWGKAKTLAGKEGISSVISRALLDFVGQRTSEDASSQRFHFEIFGSGREDDDPLNPTAVIGFEGRRVLSKTFDLEVSPFDQSGKSVEAAIRIYRTKLGTLVLLATPVADGPESESAFAHYQTFGSVRELMSGLVVGCMYPPNRHELLTELTMSLGKDAVTWID